MRLTHLAPALFLCIFLLSVLLHASTAALSSDAVVMFELKKYLVSPMPDWWVAPEPCKWDNVKCANHRVTQIQIGNNGLTGTLPNSLNQLSELQIFEVMGNQLSGPLPSFSGLSSLQRLLLNDNQFTEIPSDFFQGTTSLQAVYLDNNPFKPWNIPESLKDSLALQNFSAMSANVSGQIPTFLSGLASLINLHLSFNLLEGRLPDGFSGSSIQSLWLNSQKSESKFNGSIVVLQNMTSLVDVRLHGNMFTGPIPDLSALKFLEHFSIRDNQLTGPVPDSLVNLASLKSVNLTNNLLQGKMPKFGLDVDVDNAGLNKYCSSLPGHECDWRVGVFLDVARSLGYPMVFAQDWGGNDPCAWGEVTCDSASKNVTVMNFQNKLLSGTIAPEFSKFTTLQKLYLNNNSLTGTIPDVFAEIRDLMLLDVSFNNVFGQLPKFRNNVVVKHEGTRIGKDPPSIIPLKSGGSSPKVTIRIILGSTGGFVVISLAMFIFIKRRRRIGKALCFTDSAVVVHPRDVHVIESGNMVISVIILKTVTNNFSQENILGRGGFGTVYKGELHDRTKIAVKRMDSREMSDEGLAEFQAEIDVLTKVRHRHLVNLLGHCLEGNEKILVYEYMPQGTLSTHLFDWAKENLKPLDWSRRLIIALDVARGVEYLHNLAHQSFIHRDLKPSNILLGDDMRAKVADFGLVRLAPDGKNSFATKLAGTFGYLAPEYAVTGRITTKVDVFSFGVILMELITGRKALDDSQPDESCHLVTWFRKMSIDPDTFQKFIDPAIDLTKETLASIQNVAELAGHCSARDPHQRPDMSHVVNILSSLAELWKPAKQDAEEDLYGFDLKMTLPQALKRWQQVDGNSNTKLSSSSFWDSSSTGHTQTNISPRPYGFSDSFTSTDGR